MSSDAGLDRSPANTAEFLLDARAVRARHLPAGFDAEPAWDLLLCLSAADAKGSALCAADLIDRAGVPAATVLRWLAALEKEKFVSRRRGGSDRRRVDILLTPLARRHMNACLEEIGGLRDLPAVSRSELDRIIEMAGRLSGDLKAMFPPSP